MQLPGREQRHGEPPIRRIGIAADAAAAAMRGYLDRPYALFGHSLGSVLAYEVARRLVAETGTEPVHLFVSGRRAPHLPARRPPLYKLADDAFLEGLKALNGTPAEVFENPEMVRLLMPLLRADFEMEGTYAVSDGPQLFCPVTAMGGNADGNVLTEDLEAWRTVTRGAFNTMIFDGDHFYINTERRRLLEQLSSQLSAWIRQDKNVFHGAIT